MVPIVRYSLLIVALVCSIGSAHGQKIHGISFSGPPRPVGDSCLAQIRAVGAEWVCFVPYAFGPDESGRLVFNIGDRQWWGERPDGIRQLVRMAKAKGLKVMLKPHLWLGHGEFTGRYTPPGGWEPFEASYTEYVLLWAEIAKETGVDLYCVGTELEGFVHERTAFWQRLIDRVSDVYEGPLTYAANWDEVARFPLWKRMAHIGVDGYFPLCTAHRPKLHELEQGWRIHVDMLAALSKSVGRPVLFTEMGYCCSSNCAAEPWKEHGDAIRDESAQEMAYRAFFKVFSELPWYSGCFVWKWFAEGGVRENRNNVGFSPQNKLAMRTLRRAFDAP